MTLNSIPASYRNASLSAQRVSNSIPQRPATSEKSPTNKSGVIENLTYNRKVEYSTPETTPTTNQGILGNSNLLDTLA